MRALPRPARCGLLAGLGLCLLLAGGCALSSARRVQRLERIEETPTTNVVAVLVSNILQIRISVPGRDLRVRATWPDAGASNGNGHYLVRLETDKRTPGGPALTRSWSRDRVPARGPVEWRQLNTRLVESLVPRVPDLGVLLFVHEKELVAYRDRAGRVRLVPVEERPPEVTVMRTVCEEAFAGEALELLRTSLRELVPPAGRVLFVTGDDPAFVFVDVPRRLTVFLTNPVDDESPSRVSPPGFALRTLDWLIVRSLLVTALKNPVTLVSRGLWHIGNSGAAVVTSGLPAAGPAPPPLSEAPGMDLDAWEKDLDHLVSSRRYRGTLDLFIDGESFFSALIQSLQDARRSIDMLVYIFDNDDYAVKIADLLKVRSHDVRVRVLMDEMGTLFASINASGSPSPPGFEPPANIASYLRHHSRVHVRKAANPWLTANHTKLIVVDQRLAYLGGMNIGREYRYDWHDLMVRVTGPIVSRLAKDFHLAWEHAGWFGDLGYSYVKIFDREDLPRQALADGIELRPLYTTTGKMEVYRAQMEALRRARRYVFVENSYLLDDRIVRELVAARERGVDVRVILPGVNDIGVMNTSNLVTANTLIVHGVRVYWYPGMSHVKAAIYDGWACLGSANFNKMSLHVEQEINIAFSDPAATARLRQELFEADFAKSKELKKPVPVTFMDTVVEALTDQF